jgi:hypothetical protein
MLLLLWHAIYMQDAIEALQVDYSPHIRTV